MIDQRNTCCTTRATPIERRGHNTVPLSRVLRVASPEGPRSLASPRRPGSRRILVRSHFSALAYAEHGLAAAGVKPCADSREFLLAGRSGSPLRPGKGV